MMTNDPHSIEGFSDYHRSSFNSMIERLERATQHLFRRPKNTSEPDRSATAWSSDWIAARGDYWKAQAIVRKTDHGYQSGVVLSELGHDVSVHWGDVKPELDPAKNEAKESLKDWLSERDVELTHFDRQYRGYMIDIEIDKVAPLSESQAFETAAHRSMIKANDAMLARRYGPPERWPELERYAAVAMRAARKAFAAERENIERSRREQGLPPRQR